MGDGLTATIIFSVISLLIGILIGEPLKHFFKRLFAKMDSAKNQESISKKLKNIMPDLLAEMKKDLLSNPLNREFVIMSKNWIYNGNTVAYFFEDHTDLKDKMNILENHMLLTNITYNNVERYKMSEDFIEMLKEYI